MTINTSTSSSEEQNKYTFPQQQKEEFVLQACLARSECFQGYHKSVLQNLFDEDYSSQTEFDQFMDNLLEQDITYYFKNNIYTYETNPLYVDQIKATLVSMMDTFVWNFNEFKDKLTENANNIASSLVQIDFNEDVKKETNILVNGIFEKIPTCMHSVKSKREAQRYVGTNPDVSSMFVHPNLFAAQLSFANVTEQASIAHIIQTEYQRFTTVIEEKKKDYRDRINPKEIDTELFERINTLYKMLLDWRTRAYKSLHIKVMNHVHADFIIACMQQTTAQNSFKA